MNRSDLVADLALVSKALGAHNMIQVFQSFCFKDGRVWAYNGELGIQAPCSVEGAFGLHGETLLKLLKATKSKEIDILSRDNSIEIVSGESKLTMPFLTEEAFVFEPTSSAWQVSVDLTSEFIEGLRVCLLTAARDSSMEALMGVRLVLDDPVRIYSCDNDSITKAVIPELAAGGEIFVLSNAFCETLIRICKDRDFGGRLFLGEDWACAKLGRWAIYGRMKPVKKDLDFEKLLKETIKTEPVFGRASPELREALVRASTLGAVTEANAYQGVLRLTTVTSFGIVDDGLECLGQEKRSARINAGLLMRALTVCDEFCIQENCTIARRGENLLVLSANAA
jgi:DNA polymerase III sliding clamp (beta) subunit (PCNA family)